MLFVIFLLVAPKVTLQQLSRPSSSKTHQTLTSGFAIRGDELHLYCNISGNPPVDNVLWYLNSHKLNKETNTSDSNQSKFVNRV